VDPLTVKNPKAAAVEIDRIKILAQRAWSGVVVLMVVLVGPAG
jgi:hypothetical protein